jgi:hypothetical protein
MRETSSRAARRSSAPPHCPASSVYARPVPDQFGDAKWNALIREPDTFKLAIRGFAAIEADIDAFIEEAFESPLPGGSRSLGGFDRRLRVAAALGLAPTFVAPISALARIRHDFANGNIDVIDEARARALGRAYESALPPDAVAAIEGLSPRNTLAAALIGARAMIRVSVEAVRIRRAELSRPAEGEAFRQAILNQLRDQG